MIYNVTEPSHPKGPNMLRHLSQQKLAVIDLGSNTARLVIYAAVPGYAYRLDDEIREVVRLRQGMTADGLSPAAVERAFSALHLFKRFCDAMQVDVIIPTATSAVRDAANGPAFVERVRNEIGLTLRILDGEREAYYGAIGALNDTGLRDGAIIDIGGGSTQVSQVAESRFVRGQSAPIGALALTDRFVDHDPARKREVRAIQDEIDRRLDGFDWLTEQQGDLVGLGGTIRNLAAIEAARCDYPLHTLHGFRLTAAAVDESIEALRTLPLSKRRKIAGLNADRADIILPGAMVLRSVMDRLDAGHVTISINGLREGLFLEQFWGHLADPVAPDVRGFGVLNMARTYDYQKNHANHVRFLARRLFDQLAPLHGYGAWERALLDAGALLHDLGTLITYHRHERHSLMLITNGGLPGFSPREIALIALLARYHRKGTPRTREYDSLLEADDEERLACLAALLRVAEYLERGRNIAIDDVVVTWTDDRLRLTLIADLYPAVEIWQTEGHAAELLSAVFAREVLVESTAAPSLYNTPAGDG